LTGNTEQRSVEAVLNIKFNQKYAVIFTYQETTQNQQFSRDPELSELISQTLQQRFSIITGHAHKQIPSTQTDVKLLSVFGTGTVTAGIGPHSRIYNFLNQVVI